MLLDGLLYPRASLGLAAPALVAAATMKMMTAGVVTRILGMTLMTLKRETKMEILTTSKTAFSKPTKKL